MVEQCDYIICPHCGRKVPVAKMNRSGRKPLNISLKNICEALQAHRSAVVAAQELNCSQGYIFNVLKANGLKLKDIINKRTQHS